MRSSPELHGAAEFTLTGPPLLAERRSWALATFRRYPATTMVTAPYLLLILPQAILFSNPALPFIARVMAIAAIPVFIVESLAARVHNKRVEGRRPTYSHRLYLVARLTTSIGALAGAAGAMLGARSVFRQVGLATGNTTATAILSVFNQWDVIGLGLLIACHRGKLCSRAQLMRWTAILIGSAGLEAYFSAITAPLFVFLISLAALLLYAGIVTLRQCLLLAVIVLIAWPTVFALRNELRLAGGVRVDAGVGATERLRYDRQIGRAEELGYGIDVGAPGPVEILRYGLIPRVLDPSRPALSTGTRINEYLGGTSTSSLTFLPVTTLFVLEGPLVLAAFYSAWGLALHILMKGGRAASPMRLAVFSLIITGPLDWFAGYPDSSIGLLQGLVSLVPVAILVRQCRVAVPAASHCRVVT